MIPSPSPTTGLFEGSLHRYALRAFHEDTDATGRVYHGAYLRWFERARSDILSLLDIDQLAAFDGGEGFYVVAEANLRYFAPALLGDTVLIETLCEASRPASARMHQTAFARDTRLCEARIRLGFVGPDGKPRSQPVAWRAAFDALLSGKETA